MLLQLASALLVLSDFFLAVASLEQLKLTLEGMYFRLELAVRFLLEILNFAQNEGNRLVILLALHFVLFFLCIFSWLRMAELIDEKQIPFLLDLELFLQLLYRLSLLVNRVFLIDAFVLMQKRDFIILGLF